MSAFTKLYATMPLLQREALKSAYRKSGAKKEIPLIKGSWELLDAIRRRSNLKIAIMTNRPYAQFHNIYSDTLAWLKVNDLPFDCIIWSRDKGIDALRNFKNTCFAVDDDPANVARLRQAGITTIKIDNFDPNQSTHALYLLAERIAKVEDLGYAWASEKEVRA